MIKGYSQFLSPEIAQQEVENLFAQYDVDNTGQIDYNGIRHVNLEFVLATAKKHKLLNEENIIKLFNELDTD